LRRPGKANDNRIRKEAPVRQGAFRRRRSDSPFSKSIIIIFDALQHFGTSQPMVKHCPYNKKAEDFNV
jgi:hypothetical protein